MKKLCILIPFHNPWNWHTDYTNQTAILLSKHYTVICYLWGDAISIKELVTQKKWYRPLTHTNNLWLYHPLFLIPGKRIIFIQWINMCINLICIYCLSYIIAGFKKQTLLFWFFGFFDPVFLLFPLFFRHTPTVYDCVDIPSHPNKKIHSLFTQSEQKLLSYARIVTANSKIMHTRLIKIRPDTHHVPLGFRKNMFSTKKPYHISLKHNRPIIGYIGAIDYRIDLSLLEYLITHHRQWQFIIAGPVFNDHLTKRQISRLHTCLSEPNVKHMFVTNSHIPSVLEYCDITIIPYNSNSTFNQYAFPMKTMEYLYAQKRIVATRGIKELHEYASLIDFASTAREWEQRIKHALAHPFTNKEKIEAKNIASHHTWEKKIHALCVLLEKKNLD